MTARRYPTRRPAPEPDRGTDWRDHAACLGHEDLHDAAMPSQPWGPPMDRDAAEAATSICATCPVRAICLDRFADDPWVIAGGTTPRQRHHDANSHDCDDCARTFETSMALAVHRTKVHPRMCPECGKPCRSERAVSMHWATMHRRETGTCIRGHEVAPTGLCRTCKTDSDRASQERARRKREDAA